MIAEYLEPPVGMGGLLSTLTFGLIGKKVKKLSRDEIMGQMASQVSNVLAERCMVAPMSDMKGGVGHIINQYSAWDLVMTDANIVQQIATETANAMVASGVCTVAQGCANAGAKVKSDGTVDLPPSATPVVAGLQTPIALPQISSSNLPLVAGIGIGAMLLLRRRRRGRR